LLEVLPLCFDRKNRTPLQNNTSLLLIIVSILAFTAVVAIWVIYCRKLSAWLWTNMCTKIYIL